MKKVLSVLLAVALCLACFPAFAEGYEDLLEKAESYIRAGDYGNAALYYFTLSDMGVLDDAQREAYRKALATIANPGEAEQLDRVNASTRNAALDAAFDDYTLTLVQAELPAVTVDAFEFPDEIWVAFDTEKPDNPEAELAPLISDAEFEWLSLSPSGNSGILVADGTIGIGCFNGKYHLLFPSRSHGVEDIHGNLSKVAALPLQRLLSEAGVAYSPDGRYAAIFNTEYTLMRAQFILDPIVIDLSTGEMILTATYGNNLMKETAGAVTTATFSSDGRYLYYMLYGNATQFRTALYRYDLEAQKTELCYSGGDLNYYPTLSETGDGALVILRDVPQSSEPAGITCITYENEAWHGREYTFDLPLKYWYCNRLIASSNSGYALIPGRMTAAGAYYAFQCIRPDEDFSGMNKYYAISKNGYEILPLSGEEINAMFDSWASGAQEDSASRFNLDMPFQIILTSVLSPDGHYALLHTLDYGTRDNPAMARHLYLVRLDDLAMREIRGIDPASIQVGDLGADYKPVIEWNTDTLIIGTADGIQGYKLQLQ